MILAAAGSIPAQCFPLTHYCIVRRDLPLGVIAAMLIHAAGESAGGLWGLAGAIPPNTFAVALAAKNEPHLEFIEAKLRRLAIPHQAIREPDAPFFGALMAIGIHPIADRSTIKKVTKGLQLIQ